MPLAAGHLVCVGTAGAVLAAGFTQCFSSCGVLKRRKAAAGAFALLSAA